MHGLRSLGSLVVPFAWLVACGSASSATDTATGPEAENPRQVCDRYLACIAQVAPSGLPAAQMGFGDDGTCWDGSDKDAQLCLDACASGLEQYHDLFPRERDCDLCREHAECDEAAGELCYQGECTVTTCGNGQVEAEEICDSQAPGCDADCQGPSACNPISGHGCTSNACTLYPDSGSATDLIAQCLPSTLVPAGQACAMMSLGLACEPGFACTAPAQLPTCDPDDQDGCCARLCLLGATSECTDGETCVPYEPPADYPLPPDLDYVGVCVPT